MTARPSSLTGTGSKPKDQLHVYRLVAILCGLLKAVRHENYSVTVSARLHSDCHRAQICCIHGHTLCQVLRERKKVDLIFYKVIKRDSQLDDVNVLMISIGTRCTLDS